MRKRPPHVPNGFYHVIMRGVQQRVIFDTPNSREQLGRLIQESLRRHDAKAHAFCWMTNHVHMIVQVSEIPLGNVVHHFATRYARSYNRRNGFSGHLFDARHYPTWIDTTEYLMQCVRYVHRNPVEAGMVTAAHTYRWSSARTYAGEARVPWLTTSFVLDLFGANESTARSALAEFTARDKDGRLPSDSALEQIVAQACATFEVTDVDLRGPARHRTIMDARTWIAREATRYGIASKSAVARRLNRVPSAIGQLLKRRCE